MSFWVKFCYLRNCNFIKKEIARIIVGYALQGCNFVKTLIHHRPFSRNIIFKTNSFWKYNLWWNPLIVELQSIHCRLVTLLNKTPSSFPENFRNFFIQLFFVRSSSVLKNWITWKLTWKSMVTSQVVIIQVVGKILKYLASIHH